MKHNFVAVGLLAGALVSSHSATSEAAVERVQYRGEIAGLSLFQLTELTCEDGSAGALHTAVSLQLFAEGARGSMGNSSTRSIMLFFSERDTCTATSREFMAFEEPAEYTQRRVQSADFAHSFDMVDVFTGEPIGTLTLDVELQGIGPTDHINTHTTTESGEFTIRSHVNGASRQATASGTVDLAGTELIDADQFGTLSDIHSGEMTITR